MSLNPCIKCGAPVRLGAMKIRLSGKPGIAHYVAHMHGTGCQATKEYTCGAEKPYPTPRPYELLIERWNRDNPVCGTPPLTPTGGRDNG